MLFRFSTWSCGGFLLLGVLTLAGCGPNYKARGSVKGKVTFAGKALPVGNIMFLGKNKMSASSVIDKEGNYIMNDAPLGDVVITVSVPNLAPGSIARMKPPPGTKDAKSVDPEGSGKSIPIMGELPTHVVPIPSKYANEATSGLTYTVVRGTQTHNIDLKP